MVHGDNTKRRAHRMSHPERAGLRKASSGGMLTARHERTAPMGRPVKTRTGAGKAAERVNLYLDSKLRTELVKIAKRNNTTLNGQIAQILERGLEQLQAAA